MIYELGQIAATITLVVAFLTSLVIQIKQG